MSAIRYQDSTLADFNFIEAKVMLDRGIQSNNGNVHIAFGSDDWGTDCGVVADTNDDMAFLYCNLHTSENYMEGPAVPFNTWHTVRIEIDPESTELKYIVDGQQIATYTPPEADVLRKAKFGIFGGE